MDQPEDKLQRNLENWRKGQTSLEDVRSMAIELGNQHYHPGIPVLVELLDHQDEIVRNNAIIALGFDLHHSAIAERLLPILANDQDSDCRGSAASALGNLCRDTKNRNVLEALGKAALNDPDEDVRISAYKALLSVNGLSHEEHLKILTDQHTSIDRIRVEDIVGNESK